MVEWFTRVIVGMIFHSAIMQHVQHAEKIMQCDDCIKPNHSSWDYLGVPGTSWELCKKHI